MKQIFYHINNPKDSSAERWIYEVWKDGFLSLGMKLTPISDSNFVSALKSVDEAVLMTDICVLNLPKYSEFLSARRKTGLKTAAWVHWPLIKEINYNEKFFHGDGFADLYFGERENDGEAFIRDTGKKYVCIPHAASPRLHQSEINTSQCKWDIVYLGSRLPKKKWFEENILYQLKKEKGLKVLIIGSGWKKNDSYLNLVRFILKRIKNKNLKALFDQMTVKIKPEEEGCLYRSAKICLNFHERDEYGSQPHYIVNSRTFKIPACGGFQICDEVPAIRKYFSDQEVVMCPINKQAWMQTIHYYLQNDIARVQIQQAGAKRARLNHLSPSRCLQLLELLKLK